MSLHERFHSPQIAWGVLALSILLTLVGWLWSASVVEQRAQERFDLEVENAQVAIQLRMRSYEHVLRGGEGMFLANGLPDRKQWRDYVTALRLDEYYPGMQGLGFGLWVRPEERQSVVEEVRKNGYPDFDIKPEGERPEYSCVIYLEPLSGRNLKAFGYDMWSEATRRSAMARARDLDKPALSGRVTLVQESSTNIQPGVLLYIPVYKPGLPHTTPVERQAALLGWVYSPFRLNDLMRGILGDQSPHLGFYLFDSANTTPEHSLYKSDDHGKLVANVQRPRFQESRTIKIAGRLWTCVYHSQPAFEAAYVSSQPLLIGIGGAFINAILFIAMGSMSRRQEGLRRFNLELERRVEERTRETRDLRAAIDEHAIVAVTDASGNIEYANANFFRVSRYSLGELYGMNHRVLNSGTHSKQFYENLWSTVMQGKVWHGELCNRAKDGSHYWVHTTIVPFLSPSGEPRNFISISAEITAQKQAEEELLRAKDFAEAANHAKSEFLATMSHEIRTPMNGVLGFTNLLLDTPLNADQKQCVTTIKSSGEALLSLINDILDFSKIESGKLILENIKYDLVQAIEEVAELVLPKMQDKDLELALRIDPDTPAFLVGDPGRVRQVLLNLIGNAIKFTERGHVLIEVEPLVERGKSETSTVGVRVTDTGIGISDDKQRGLFQQFFQADASTTRRFGGTGLGLAISKQLVELMGGHIALCSQPGVGSTFSFTLPAPSSLPAPGIPTLVPESFAGGRFLIAQRVPINRELIHEVLQRWGIDHDAVATGADALQALREAHSVGRPYQLVILDSKIRPEGVVGIARSIRNDPKLNATMLLLTTSGGLRESSEVAEVGGLCDVHIAKPLFKVNEFQEALAELSRRQEARREPLQLEYPSAAVPNVDRGTLPSPGDSPAASETQFRVLLAEDNATNQLLAKRLLGKLGCRVDVAGNGQEAVTMVSKLPYDIVFMDCHMPEMDGFQATGAIRKLEEGRTSMDRGSRPLRIPIVAVTASARESDRLECLASGMDDFISKPIHPDSLRKALEKWCRKSGLAA